MMNNGFIIRIINFFKRIFLENNQKLLIEGNVITTQDTEQELKQPNNFKEQIAIPRDYNKERLLSIRQQWENGEINEEDILKEDIDGIVAIYNEETEKIEEETKRIKDDVAKIIEELKKTA